MCCKPLQTSLNFCFHCSLGNYVSLNGHFYCLHHYKQLLQSKGIYDNGSEQKTAVTGGLIPSNEKLEWRYSMSSLNSVDKIHTENNLAKTCDDSKLNSNKISVVWPPQSDPPKKAFKIEDDIQVVKPHWPPADNAPKSPQLPHRKAVPRSVL